MSPVSSVSKPYTFGLESVASSTEVNQNFDVLYGGHNAVVTLLNSLETQVTNTTLFRKASQYASFAAAVVSQGTSETTLYIDTEMPVTTDVTVPSTITLYFGRGGSLNIAITKTVTVQGPLVAGPHIIAKGFGTLNLHAAQAMFVLPEWWSATGGIKQAVDNACEAGVILLQRKIYTETAKIAIAKRGVKILGVIGERNNGSIKGTQINFTHNDALFEMGTDDGEDWDSDNYDGPQLFEVESVNIKYTGSTTTPLSNGAGNYGTNTVGIRDWRGGHVRLKNVQFENLDYSFWGIQSDINDFDITELYCEHGVFAGPRCDQFRAQIYALYCTQALILDGCVTWGSHIILKECGHEDKSPIEIRQISTSNRQCHFSRLWAEDYSGGTSSYVRSFVSAGVNAGNEGTATQSVEVIIDEMTYWVNNTVNHTRYLVEVGKGYVHIKNPKGDFNNIEYLVSFVGNYTAADSGAYVDGRSFLASKAFINNGTGSPAMGARSFGPEGGVVTASSNKHQFRRIPANPGTDQIEDGKSFSLYSAVDYEFAIEFTERSTATDGSDDIFRVKKRHYEGLRGYIDGSAKDNPVTGTWDLGDSFTFSGSAAYEGKRCEGSAGTMGVLNPGTTTGNISSGTNDLTVASATDAHIGGNCTIAGVTGVKVITNVVGTTVTLDSNADADVTGGVVTFSKTTGSISSDSPTLTVSSATGIYKGCYLAIAGVSGVKKVTAVSGTTITLDSNSDATVADAGVRYFTAKFKVYGATAGSAV